MVMSCLIVVMLNGGSTRKVNEMASDLQLISIVCIVLSYAFFTDTSSTGDHRQPFVPMNKAVDDRGLRPGFMVVV